MWRWAGVAMLASIPTTAVTENNNRPIPLAPEVTEPACDPQVSDAEKIRNAIAFSISTSSSSPMAPIGDGYFDARFLTTPETALAAQPGCCEIKYVDPELYRSQELKDRLGSNFGGFVFLKFAILVHTGTNAGHTYYSTDYYVLNACGDPVFSL